MRLTKVLDPVGLAVDAFSLLVLEGWWEIEADPEGKCDCIDGKQEPVHASPANRVTFDECIRDDRAESTACDRPRIDEAGAKIAVLHGQQLLQHI